MTNLFTNLVGERRKAFVLCLFLGLFGAHRFYLNEPVKGTGYLLFSWTFIPLVLSFIDAAFLLRMSDEDFYEEYEERFETARAS